MFSMSILMELLFIEIIHQISLSGFSKSLNRTNELENTVDLDQLSSDRSILSGSTVFSCQYWSIAIKLKSYIKSVYLGFLIIIKQNK